MEKIEQDNESFQTISICSAVTSGKTLWKADNVFLISAWKINIYVSS